MRQLNSTHVFISVALFRFLLFHILVEETCFKGKQMCRFKACLFMFIHVYSHSDIFRSFSGFGQSKTSGEVPMPRSSRFWVANPPGRLSVQTRPPVQAHQIYQIYQVSGQISKSPATKGVALCRVRVSSTKMRWTHWKILNSVERQWQKKQKKISTIQNLATSLIWNLESPWYPFRPLWKLCKALYSSAILSASPSLQVDEPQHHADVPAPGHWDAGTSATSVATSDTRWNMKR